MARQGSPSRIGRSALTPHFHFQFLTSLPTRLLSKTAQNLAHKLNEAKSLCQMMMRQQINTYSQMKNSRALALIGMNSVIGPSQARSADTTWVIGTVTIGGEQAPVHTLI